MRARAFPRSSGGPIRSVLRAYLVLARIAAHRIAIRTFAALLLRPKPRPWRSRAWPAWVSHSCRANLIAWQGRTGEGSSRRLWTIRRYTETHPKRDPVLPRLREIQRYRLSRHAVVVGLGWKTHRRWNRGARLRAASIIPHPGTEEVHVGSGLAVELAGNALRRYCANCEKQTPLSWTLKGARRRPVISGLLEGGAEIGRCLLEAELRYARTVCSRGNRIVDASCLCGK